jgi:hypothetical protein
MLTNRELARATGATLNFGFHIGSNEKGPPVGDPIT